MRSAEFVRQLEEELNRVLQFLEGWETVEAESHPKMEIQQLLKIALKNELEATELAAFWIPTTPEIDVKLGFARQAGDEAKHYKLIEKRFKEMGVDLSDFHPLTDGHSKLFDYLKSLSDTVPRLAAGQFTREGIALKRNEQFIHFCEMKGDQETAKLYREIIQPDEQYHHQLGKTMLEKYAITPEQQQAALLAAQNTLSLAEELRGIAENKLHIRQIPGC